MSKEGDNATQFNSNFDINSPKIPFSQNDKIHGRMYDSYSNTSIKNTIQKLEEFKNIGITINDKSLERKESNQNIQNEENKINQRVEDKADFYEHTTMKQQSNLNDENQASDIWEKQYENQIITFNNNVLSRNSMDKIQSSFSNKNLSKSFVS